MDLELAKEVLYEVDWSQPWLIGLFSFHAVTAIAIILLRHHQYIQAALLALLALLCFSSERINEYAAMNYDRFAKEQYFDSGGFFLLVVFAGPIICNCFLIVFCWMYGAWELMGKVVVLKAKRQRQQKRAPSEKKVANTDIDTSADSELQQCSDETKKDQ